MRDEVVHHREDDPTRKCEDQYLAGLGNVGKLHRYLEVRHVMAIEVLPVDPLGHYRLIDLLLYGPTEHIVTVIAPYMGQCSTPVAEPNDAYTCHEPLAPRPR